MLTLTVPVRRKTIFSLPSLSSWSRELNSPAETSSSQTSWTTPGPGFAISPDRNFRSGVSTASAAGRSDVLNLKVTGYSTVEALAGSESTGSLIPTEKLPRTSPTGTGVPSRWAIMAADHSIITPGSRFPPVDGIMNARVR